MALSLGETGGVGLEPSCAPDEWMDTSGPVDGVELFRARLHGHPFGRHRHDVYAIGVSEEGVQGFGYRGTVEHSLPGQVFVLHPDEPHDGFADGPRVDQAHFTRTFKAAFGLTPGRYVKLCAGKRNAVNKVLPVPLRLLWPIASC
jgi:hypothetical protein